MAVEIATESKSAGSHLVVDRISGALLGYAIFGNIVTVYDRSGNVADVSGNEAGVTPSWLQPADLIAGPIQSALGKVTGYVGVRTAVDIAEDVLADDAASGAVSGRMRRPPWKHAQLKPDNLGYTTPEGDIFINSSLKQGTKEFEETLAHESVHRALTARTGLFVKARQKASQWFFDNSHLLQYSEEALAEGYTKGSLLQGLAYPFRVGLTIRGKLVPVNPFLLTGEGGIYAAGLYGSYRLGQDLRGEWDSR